MGGNIIEGLHSVKIFEEGKAEGEIIGAVKLFKDELNLEPPEIVEKIKDRFSLSDADALRYVSEALAVDND